jgi:hypothetical protein
MAGTVIADNLQAASTSQLVIKNGVASTPPTIQDSAGTQIGTFCRAWVNFNGTGTVAIRASFNVSSITDNGTGDYTVNFTTAMPDANYIFAAGNTVAVSSVNGVYHNQAQTKTTSAIRLIAYSYVASATDNTDVYVSFFR